MIHLLNTPLKKTFIYNSLPDEVYEYKASRTKELTKFIYASAAMKGLNETVSFFKTMKKDYFFKKAELTVLSPGYDKPSNDILNDKKLTFKGALPFQNVVKELAASNAMLYVNTMPETYGISVVLSEVLGTTPFVLFTNHAGALPEVLNSDHVMSNPELMYEHLVEFSKNPNPKRVQAKDFRTSKIMPLWRELLKV